MGQEETAGNVILLRGGGWRVVTGGGGVTDRVRPSRFAVGAAIGRC